ncbi:hypothetical protein BHE74_00028540, partial [Ensete ventricosum]
MDATGYDEGRSKRKREKKGENLRQCRPLTVRRWLDYRRCLRPKNLGTTSRMRTSQGDDFQATVFSSLPSRLRRREKEGSVNNFSPARGEASTTSHPRGEKKTRFLLPAHGEENDA